MSEAEYSILRPNPEDFVFRFKGKAYPVLKGIFYCYSKKFAQSPELQSQSEFVANFDVSEESFKEFINACQGKSFSISKETIFDLEFLGNFWGVSDLRSKVAKIIKGDQTGQLRLDSTIYKVQHKLGTDADEQVLIDNIESNIEDDRFAQFPIDVLQRLIYNEKFAAIDTEKKYNFLKKVLQVHGKEASSLFADLVKTPLEQEELENILREKLVLQPLPRNLARSTVKTSRYNAALNQINADINNALKAIINELGNNHENLDLSQAVESLQHASELGDRQASEILSEIYSKGIGVDQDEEKANEYANKANDPNESSESISNSAISDLLDNSDDTNFDLEPSLSLPRPASPYEDLQFILSSPRSSPSSPTRGSPRSHHKHPFSIKKEKPKPAGPQRRIPVAKPKNTIQEQEEPNKMRNAHRKAEDAENAKEELELLDEDQSDELKEGEEVKERGIELEENENESPNELNDKQSDEEPKKETDSDFFFESPRKKLGPFHDNNIESEDGNGLRSGKHRRQGKGSKNADNQSDGEGENRLNMEDQQALNSSKSCDLLLSPKGRNARRTSFSSDSKTHLPHGLSEDEKIDNKLTDDDDIGQSVADLEKRAAKDDLSALFILGVLYWGDGTANPEANAEVDAGDVEVEVDSTFKPDQKKAVEFYEKAAELGEPRSMFNLATIYDFYHGDNIEQNLPRAIELYQKAADNGEVCAQTNLGVLYETGTGVEQDVEKAAEIYQKAADEGDSDAMLNLGMLYETGRGVGSVNIEKAAELYEKAADKGDTDAQVKLALLYEKGEVPGKPADLAKAASLYRQAAENGNADAQFNLATMYEQGEGVEKDDSKVVEWYSKSAENGNPDALFNLGVLYQNGQLELDQDYSTAYNFYQRSADAGNPTAYYNMAVMLFNNEVNIDEEENSRNLAYKYFLKSAELGCPDAQFFAGQLYEYGEHVEKDLVKAAQLYREAADNGNMAAQYNLGVLYTNGDGGVTKNIEQAKHYYQLAADQGDSDALFNMEMLEQEE